VNAGNRPPPFSPAAEPPHRQAREARRKKIGQTHMDTLISWKNLVTTLREAQSRPSSRT
jgi:hypothetical protein